MHIHQDIFPHLAILILTDKTYQCLFNSSALLLIHYLFSLED